VARIAEQLQKQAKNVVLTAITGKAAQTLQEKLPKCLNKVVTTIHKCLGKKKLHWLLIILSHYPAIW
jgi:hypothetical protein